MQSFKRVRLIEGVLTIVFFAFIALAVVRLLWVWGQAVAYPYELDYGEGPLLNSARLLAEGDMVYPSRFDHYPFIVTEHPPVVVGLLAIGIRVFGVGYAPGRVLGLVSTFAAAAAIYFLLLTIGTHRKAAFIGAGLFLAMPFLPYWSSLIRVDLPALAFSLWGLLVVLRGHRQPWGVIGGAFLFALAAYSRQTYLLAGPLAATGWLFMTDRRRTWAFTGIFAAMILIPFASLNLATHNGFFFNVVASNLQQFSLFQLWRFLTTVAAWLPLLLLVATFELIATIRTRQPAAWMVSLYLLGGLVSAASSGKIGASINYFLELMTGLTLATGLVFHLWERDSGNRRAIVFLLALAAQAWLLTNVTSLYIDYVDNRIALEPGVERLESLVAQEDDWILADEFLGLLVLKDKPVMLRPFHFSQMAAAGQWDQTQVLADIRNRRFGLILITDQEPLASEGLARDRWSPEMWTAIHQYYETTEVTACTSVLRPKLQP